ncbi:MAG: hypothetical protein A3J83_02755 [Elusimicrobia bacterium RIFOXYA2_FULL_40_6]|nr:MAG: hypothetical protein A3J83_02755 [Elusimicrobia bacterium RIFOXYA2_FULL_40_6]
MYHLRFQVIPDTARNVIKKTNDLVKFCKKNTVEEVVIFFAGEEWNNGLFSKKEEDLWFETVKIVKNTLDKNGISTSLNPWMTLLHCVRGRKFPKDRKFLPAVSPEGEISKASSSFADPHWRKYLFNLFGRFAKLGFRVIWIEDDFRYHNHSPLTWGCGFEPEMLERFSKKIGKKVTRKDVLKNILRPGEPHPWRKKWMETWNEAQLEVAEGLAQAVAKNSPRGTKIGLMSSHPYIHSTEGRDWKKLFSALTINGKVAHRPGFAPYAESTAKDKTFPIMMLDVQKGFRPSYCEVAPEIENFPFTNWTKPDAQAWTDMMLAMFYGSDKLFLDLFPFTGNSVKEEPGIGDLLSKSRPALEWVQKKFSKGLQTRGVGIPWKQDAQAFVHTKKGKSLKEFDAVSFSPGYLFLSYGIPVSAKEQQVNAVFGSLAWAFSDDEIYRLLSKGLLLDGLSASILCRRGFGKYLGVKFNGVIGREEGNYAVEVVNSDETGVKKGVYFSVNLAPELYVFTPLRQAREWTTIISPDRKRFGPGITVYENSLGGRTAIYSVEDPAGLAQSDNQQKLVHSIVRYLSKNKFESPMVTGGPHLLPMHFSGNNEEYLVILNGCPGKLESDVKIDNIPGSRIKFLLKPLAKPAIVTGKAVSDFGHLDFLVYEKK